MQGFSDFISNIILLILLNFMQKRLVTHLTILPNKFGMTNNITQQRIYFLTRIMNHTEPYGFQYYDKKNYMRNFQSQFSQNSLFRLR